MTGQLEQLINDLEHALATGQDGYAEELQAQIDEICFEEEQHFMQQEAGWN